MTDKFSVSSIFLNAALPLTPRDSSAAIIVNSRGELLLQLRDDREDIFFPNHWGCFGGAMDAGESRRDTLLRELSEELGMDFSSAVIEQATTITFLPKPTAVQPIPRYYYAIQVGDDLLSKIRLGEGREARFFTPAQVLAMANIMPYDKFALWLYLNSSRLNCATVASI